MEKVFTDMLGNRVTIPYPPKRIVSLVPSQTELLHTLGLEDETVGITKFCVHPETWFRKKKRVGGTKTVHTDMVGSLMPDLIIANKEENTREQIEELSARYPTWVSDIKTISDALHMIGEVGEITGRKERSAQLAKEIATGFRELSERHQPKRVAYFIWRKPWMCAGGDTFISDIITTMGWTNVFAGTKRYPEITLEDLKGKKTELVLLSSEPYPFKDAHIAEINEVLPGVEVRLVDGEMFSWYGSRMKEAIPYLTSLKI